MKGRAFWILVVALALAATVVLWRRGRTPSPPVASVAIPVPATPPAPSPATAIAATASASPPALPTPAPVIPAAAKSVPEVPIQDGKTIDFSSGVPVVKDDPNEKAAIDRAVKAMDDAAKDVTFGPPQSIPARPAVADPEKK